MYFFNTAMSSALWVDPEYRAEDTRFFEAYLREGDTVVDAGANVGFLTLFAARLVGPAGSVLSVEAHPATAACLEQNVRLNGLGQVTVAHTALGAAPGTVIFGDTPLDDQNFVGSPDAARGVVVPLTSLNALLAGGEGGVDLLKVDVEGYELEVFRGGSDVLARTACVYFESWDAHAERYGTTVGAVVEVLQEAGFHVFRRDDFRLTPVDATYGSPACENLVAVRNVSDVEDRFRGSRFHFAH
jgi:FkbM family methyltransferase